MNKRFSRMATAGAVVALGLGFAEPAYAQFGGLVDGVGGILGGGKAAEDPEALKKEMHDNLKALQKLQEETLTRKGECNKALRRVLITQARNLALYRAIAISAASAAFPMDKEDFLVFLSSKHDGAIDKFKDGMASATLKFMEINFKPNSSFDGNIVSQNDRVLGSELIALSEIIRAIAPSARDVEEWLANLEKEDKEAEKQKKDILKKLGKRYQNVSDTAKSAEDVFGYVGIQYEGASVNLTNALKLYDDQQQEFGKQSAIIVIKTGIQIAAANVLISKLASDKKDAKKVKIVADIALVLNALTDLIPVIQRASAEHEQFAKDSKEIVIETTKSVKRLAESRQELASMSEAVNRAKQNIEQAIDTYNAGGQKSATAALNVAVMNFVPKPSPQKTKTVNPLKSLVDIKPKV